jgi:hypothetical protein
VLPLVVIAPWRYVVRRYLRSPEPWLRVRVEVVQRSG